MERLSVALNAEVIEPLMAWKLPKCVWCKDKRATGWIRGEHVCSECRKAWNEQPEDGGFW